LQKVGSEAPHLLEPSGPIKFIGLGGIHVSKPYKFKWLGDIDAPKPYEFIGPDR
jgi:hypothetical protein